MGHVEAVDACRELPSVIACPGTLAKVVRAMVNRAARSSALVSAMMACCLLASVACGVDPIASSFGPGADVIGGDDPDVAFDVGGGDGPGADAVPEDAGGDGRGDDADRDTASDSGGADARRDRGEDDAPSEDGGGDGGDDAAPDDASGGDGADGAGPECPAGVTPNECGGCSELPARLGQVCGPCDSGIHVCDGAEATRCFGALGVGYETCGASCCEPGEACVEGACTPPVACTSHEDCDNDRYCSEGDGICLPWGAPPERTHDPDCARSLTIGRFAPSLQCVWEGPPEGDAYPAWRHVLSAPMVADFDFDDDKGQLHPSIVFTTDDGSDGSSELPTGLIRIIDGATCEQQYSLDFQLTSHSSPPAIGDLDGDGRPEIVAYRAGGGLVAYRYDHDADAWGVLWRSRDSAGNPYDVSGGGWGGPAIHDLDDDGVPEVLRGGLVFDATGVLLDESIGQLVRGSSPSNMGFAADLDADGRVEVTSGNGLWEWVPGTGWRAESYFDGAGLTIGSVAVADLGDYPMEVLRYDLAPEIAVVSSGSGGGEVRVQTLEGDVVFGPVAIPGGGTGGPLTIGDFDGDGRNEVAGAGRSSYTVFDLDCVPGGGTLGACASGRTDGILWTRTSQDFSSSVTGSSIFDFEGDGRAEAVYADECFVRVYEGATGDVIFSQFRSSCTWHENPIVADVDGDLNSELVIPSNQNCGTTCSGLDPGNLDPSFPGARCLEDADCLSGRCEDGLCRCSDSAECCGGGDCPSQGFVCAAPPGGVGGANTCRASHPFRPTGIRVYADALDRWVNSRPIWNQHAYVVTSVEDDGTIPRTSERRRSWEIPGLNSFRQNIQGDLEALAAPDATSRGEGPAFGHTCESTDGELTLAALACNRGAETLPPGLLLRMAVGSADGPVLCDHRTREGLVRGACERFTCRWEDPPHEAPGVDVVVIVDPERAQTECIEANNTATIPNVYCDK